MKTKILDQIRGSEQGMLQLLEELVNIDSGADALAGINAVAQRIGAFLEVLGFTVEYLETDGAPVQLLAMKAQPGKKAGTVFRAYGYGVQSRYSGGSPIQG